MAWPEDFDRDLGIQPRGMPTASYSDMVGVPEPDYASEISAGQIPVPDDYWTRLAQGGYQAPNIRFTSDTPAKGLLALLAFAGGFAQSKSNQAANRLESIDKQNARAREAAREMARRRWDMRKFELEQAKSKSAAQRQKELLDLQRQRLEFDLSKKNTTTTQKDIENEAYLRAKGAKRAAAEFPGAEKPSTAAEKQSFAFWKRSNDANALIMTPDKSGTSIEHRIAMSGPAGQAWTVYAPNVMKSSEQQQYIAAQRAFIAAWLRKESGATITPVEYWTNQGTFFVQPGDKPETIAFKHKLRQDLIEGLKFQAGRAYNEFYGIKGGPQASQEQLYDESGNEADLNAPAQEGMSDYEAYQEWKKVTSKGGR